MHPNAGDWLEAAGVHRLISASKLGLATGRPAVHLFQHCWSLNREEPTSIAPETLMAAEGGGRRTGTLQ